jgi:hypothetical protein
VLLDPVPLPYKEKDPKAVFWLPVEFAYSALAPMAVFRVPVVLK